ncbi:phosphate ABC transporter permease subunit PstC [Egicoccus sp. AB-alg2]|uniref:phosphate ABC transporter permease subunit PstC n=1 Tax=Egicoccus sp. AB-alg2 TaxID=3242693 RepID=UPI00359E5C6B
MQTTSTSPDRRPDLRATGSGRWADPVFRSITWTAGISVLVILGLMIGSTTRDAWPVFQYQGFLDFFTSAEWNSGFSRSEYTGEYGAFAFIYGTLISSAIAIAIALPLAIAISLYINRLAPKRIRRTLTYTVELLAAIPSVVYGLWGLLFFSPAVLQPISRFLISTFGNVPFVGAFFEGPTRNVNYFIAGNVLAIMILPIITAIAREVMAQTPEDQIQAAYGMGATDWEVMRRVILKRSFAGIVGATMLGLGRALGETIAVAMLIGGQQRWGASLFFAGQSMAGHIASTFQDAAPETVDALIAVGVGLFVITVIVNVLARLLVWRIGRVAGDAAL